MHACRHGDPDSESASSYVNAMSMHVVGEEGESISVFFDNYSLVSIHMYILSVAGLELLFPFFPFRFVFFSFFLS